MPPKGKLGYDPTDGTKRMGQLNAELQEVFDAQPTITRCGVEGCTWSWEGEAGDGREMFAAHRRLRHKIGMDEPGPEPTQEKLETSGDPGLDEIRDLLGHGTEVEIRLPREPEPWRREWIESLGGVIVIDPDAPMPLALQNDRKDGAMNGDSGRAALDAMDAVDAQRPEEESVMANGKRPQGYWTRERIIDAIKAWAREHGSPPKSTAWRRSDATHPSPQHVANVFGSWSEALVAAGFDRPTAGNTKTVRDPEPEPEPEPAPLPVPVAPPEPPAPPPVAADPEKVDTFELFASLASEERIEYYERLSEIAKAKAEALRDIRDAVETVRELEPA